MRDPIEDLREHMARLPQQQKPEGESPIVKIVMLIICISMLYGMCH
jgi:hypothetical protein